MVKYLSDFHVVLLCLQWQVITATVILTQDVEDEYLVLICESLRGATTWIDAAHFRSSALFLSNCNWKLRSGVQTNWCLLVSPLSKCYYQCLILFKCYVKHCSRIEMYSSQWYRRQIRIKTKADVSIPKTKQWYWNGRPWNAIAHSNTKLISCRILIRATLTSIDSRICAVLLQLASAKRNRTLKW